MNSKALPPWLRITLVVGVVVLSVGAGLFAYRWYNRPVTLTIAVGSVNGETAKIMSAIAGRLVSMAAPVRLNVMETGSALDAANAFSSGKADLAVVRGDVGDLSQAQAIIVVAHAVALIVAPTGSALTDIASLKRHVVGVVGGAVNQNIVNVLKKEYDLDRANVVFKNIAPAEARTALNSKEVAAILVVIPLTEKYLNLLRGIFPQGAKASPVFIPDRIGRRDCRDPSRL